MRATLMTVAILIVSLAAASFALADGRGHRDRDTMASLRTNPAGYDVRYDGHDRGRHLGWEKGKAYAKQERFQHRYRDHRHEKTVVRVVERPRVEHRHLTYAYREPCRDQVVVVRPYRPPVSSSLSFFIAW